MSALKLYAPLESAEWDDHEFPATIPFPNLAGSSHTIGALFSLNDQSGVGGSAPLLRAKVLHTNRVCPYCRHAAVEPIELNDGIRNRQRMVIPGTATLVGFHCQDCNAEWPAR